MKISLKGLSNKELAKLFDRAAETDNKNSAKVIVYRLAHRHHESFEAQLRFLGKRAVKRDDYPSFNMVVKLWKEREQY